jgi:hypothetical protein
MTDHHRPPHPIDHEKHNRASDAHYASKRWRGLILKYLECLGALAVIGTIIIVLVVTP